jgi:membrane protein
VRIGNDAPTGAGLPPAYADAVSADKTTRSETPLGAIGRASAHGGAFGQLKSGLQIRRSVVRMEDTATYAAALTLVQAGRTVAAADRYLKRHPWGSVLLVASAALAMTAAAGRRHANETGPITPTAKGRSESKK